MGLGRKERWLNEVKSSPDHFSKTRLDGLGHHLRLKGNLQRPVACGNKDVKPGLLEQGTKEGDGKGREHHGEVLSWLEDIGRTKAKALVEHWGTGRCWHIAGYSSVNQMSAKNDVKGWSAARAGVSL